MHDWEKPEFDLTKAFEKYDAECALLILRTYKIKGFVIDTINRLEMQEQYGFDFAHLYSEEKLRSVGKCSFFWVHYKDLSEHAQKM